MSAENCGVPEDCICGMCDQETTTLSDAAVVPDFAETMQQAIDMVGKRTLPDFAGLKVMESPHLEPMGVVVLVGSEYMRKLKEQSA